jgi:hypothetical protein
MAEIADELGWTVNTLGTMMMVYRERGYDLPYRRARRVGPKFPDQVAA